MDFKDIAALSGKNGLFKIIKPTRTGVILESLEPTPKKLIANSNNKISILKEISVYTTGAVENLPLDEILYRIKEKYTGELPVSSKSHPEDLKDFLGTVVPEFDRERVYPSDIKKMVTWYIILNQEIPEILVKKEESTEEKTTESSETPVAEAKAPAKKSAKTTKTAEAEPLKEADKTPKAEKAPAKSKKTKES